MHQWLVVITTLTALSLTLGPLSLTVQVMQVLHKTPQRLKLEQHKTLQAVLWLCTIALVPALLVRCCQHLSWCEPSKRRAFHDSHRFFFFFYSVFIAFFFSS